MKTALTAITPLSRRTCAMTGIRNLPAGAKLLYGELTALCGKENRCRVDSGYFAGLYPEEKDEIPQWISSLVQNGYVRLQAGSLSDKDSGSVHEFVIRKSS